MSEDNQTTSSVWNEEVSRQFLDFGRYIVPERERQVQTLTGLLAGLSSDSTLVELCCGEGLLAEAILEAYPDYRMIALDGSEEMLARTKKRLARFGNRAESRKFDLAASGWRRFDIPIQAFVSSLAIHHLAGLEKRALFQDLYRMLGSGGRVAIADVVQIRDPIARKLEAEQWDEAVRQRSIELDGNMAAFEFFQREGWNMYRYLDPEDIDKPSPLFDQLKWLAEVGFVDVEVNWTFAGHAIFSAVKY